MPRFCSLNAAVADAVHDGNVVAMEGFTHLIPFAAGHEVIRQGRRELTLVRMTPDLIYDQMIGAGCAARLVFSWGGNPGVGSLHRLRDAVEHGWPRPLALEEYSHAAMANAYDAGRCATAVRDLPGGALAILPTVNPDYRHRHLSIHRRTLTAVPAHAPGRHDHPRAAGRSRTATCSSTASSACRKKRSLAARRVDRHGRGGRRRRFESWFPNACILPHWTIERNRASSRAARFPRTRSATTRAITRSISHWDAISRDRETFRALDRRARHAQRPEAFAEHAARVA